MSPVIGVLPLLDQGRDSLWMLPEYFTGILESGGIPVMFPVTEDQQVLEQLVQSCDGLLFTGGHDVSPWVYGAEPLEGKISCCPQRDRMEQKLLKLALAQNKPILGICRGLQFINAAQGGTLYQDLDTEHPSEVCHRQQKPYDAPCHSVLVEEHSPLAALLGKQELAVNSRHHQAIRELCPNAKPMALSEDGLVESFWLPEYRFVWAVQWHPEHSFCSDEDSRKIFKAFINATE